MTFEELSADYLEERSVRGATGKTLKWSMEPCENLGTMFAGLRAVDITAGRIREFAAVRLGGGQGGRDSQRELGRAAPHVHSRRAGRQAQPPAALP